MEIPSYTILASDPLATRQLERIAGFMQKRGFVDEAAEIRHKRDEFDAWQKKSPAAGEADSDEESVAAGP